MGVGVGVGPQLPGSTLTVEYVNVSEPLHAQNGTFAVLPGNENVSGVPSQFNHVRLSVFDVLFTTVY